MPGPPWHSNLLRGFECQPGSKRYEDALQRVGLRRLSVVDRRHTFRTRMIAKADIRRVQGRMGHANIQTTMQYLHYAPRTEDAEAFAQAFGKGSSAADAPSAV